MGTSAKMFHAASAPGAGVFAALVFGVLPASSNGGGHVLHAVDPIGVPWDHAAQKDHCWMNLVAFSADGSRVASDGPASGDDTTGYLTEWSFPDGHLVRQLQAKPQSISPDFYYYADAHGVRETDSGKQVVSAPDTESVKYRFSADSRYVVETSSMSSPAMRVVDLEGGKVSSFGTHRAFAAAFSPDDAIVAAGYWDQVVLWNVQSATVGARLRGFGHYVTGLSFNRDGSMLAGGTMVGHVQAWDMEHRKRLWSAEVGGAASIPVFSPDGKWVAVCAYGLGQVSLIDAHTGQVVDRQRVSGIGCGSVAFSPDSRYLITPTTGGRLRWHDRGGTIKVFRIDQ
jgi:WD40 repeat protein